LALDVAAGLNLNVAASDSVDFIGGIEYGLSPIAFGEVDDDYFRRAHLMLTAGVRGRAYDVKEGGSIISSPWWAWAGWGTYLATGIVMAFKVLEEDT